MSANSLMNDPERFSLANELHARPFPELTAPCRAIHLSIRPRLAEKRDKAEDKALLIRLIDRFGGAHPAPDAAHHAVDLGRMHLRWEAHTEFVSYTIFLKGVPEKPFSDDPLSVFPAEWLASIDGRVISAAQVHVEASPDREASHEIANRRFEGCFARNSLTSAYVIDGEALFVSDLRLHPDGFCHIGLVAINGMSKARLGRIIQRFLEIESYKYFALLTLPVARRVAQQVTEMDSHLGALSTEDDGSGDARATLDELTRLSTRVETLSTETAYRFGAVGAYEAIVNDRIEVLREERVGGRQLYREFMRRRFDPAMRTCRSAERRLDELSDRVARASALLSTRVNVEVEAQNQQLLASMDRRADLQLRLQQTVEGLSVVAISYYALGLASALMAPVAGMFGFKKEMAAAVLALPVIAAVWWSVHSIKKKWGH